MEKIVLQKFIADSGLCSRRKAEQMIRDGRVKVDEKLAELGMKVNEKNKVEVDGQKLNSDKKLIYIKLNKPVGYTCTNREFKNEKNIFNLVKVEERLFAVGRLDKDSHGLVLLTNDGELTNKLTHPRYGHEKEYVAQVTSNPPMPTAGRASKLQITRILGELKKGIDVGEGDGIAKVQDIKYLGNNKFKVVLAQGKKRQLRRMFKAVDCDVVDLLRVRIGDIELGDLEEGAWEEIKYADNTQIINADLRG